MRVHEIPLSLACICLAMAVLVVKKCGTVKGMRPASAALHPPTPSPISTMRRTTLLTAAVLLRDSSPGMKAEAQAGRQARP